ncbi:MAG: alpha/beta fold hydrolase, partial [Exilispira sp.]
MEINYNIKDINFIRKGNGKKVLLLHGWGVDSTIYLTVFQYLSKSYDTIAVDFPGFGKSPIPAADWGIYEYADIIYWFIKYNNFYPCSIIGHSFGGRIAIILGSKYSDILDKII